LKFRPINFMTLKRTLRTPLRAAYILSVIVYISCIYFHQRGYKSAIPASRLDLLHSVVEHGVLNIDTLHQNTPDKAFVNGHYYSDKAPGTALLALPFFAVASLALSWADCPSDSTLGWLVTSWLSCACSQAVLASTGAGALFIWLAKRVSMRAAFLASAGIAIGGAPVAYSSLMMSHSATFGLLAWSLCLSDPPHSQCSIPWRSFLVGSCLGLTLAGEFSSGIVVIALLINIGLNGHLAYGHILLGVLPGILIIFGYNLWCFDSLLAFGYHHQVVFKEMHLGFFGIGFPSWSNACYLTFGSRQGLFVWSPVLLLAFVGFSVAPKCMRTLAQLSYASILLNIVFLSGYFLPTAGMTLGSRLLTPILVLLALPVAIGIERLPRIGYILTMLSVVVTLFMVSVEIRIPSVDVADIFLMAWRNLVRGRSSFSFAMLCGMPSLVGLGLLIVAVVTSTHLLARTLSSEPVSLTNEHEDSTVQSAPNG
jgi:hypothetical protein